MGERYQCPYTGSACSEQNCDECTVEEEEREYMAQVEIAEQYDMNGDPCRDFMGNPW